MAHVGKITATIKTANVNDASTNGRVYLGLGGREFRLNMPGNQFQKGQTNTFIIGDGGNIDNPHHGNDLPMFGGDTTNAPNVEYTDLELYPKYIRFEPQDEDDNWNMETANVIAELYFGTAGTGQTKTFVDLTGNTWLGVGTGKAVQLLKV
jgi:hypothetical protein